MINAIETRVGNRFIRELHSPRGVEYDHDFVLNEEWMGKLFGSYEYIALDDLYPIPLTTDILEKCGFEMDAAQVVPVWNHPSGFWFYDEYGTDYYSIRLMRDIDVQLKYLHQLQNIYFSLTNEELKINL